MALDTEIGGADSDSYGTLEEAEDYADAIGQSTWLESTYTDDERDQAMRRACQALDGGYRKRFPGTKVYGREQALEWPRVDAYDCEGDEIDPETIPPEIKKAQFELAFRELTSPGSLTPDVVLAQAKVLTKVGSVEWDPLATSASAGTLTPTITKVNELLGCILRSVGHFLTRA